MIILSPNFKKNDTIILGKEESKFMKTDQFKSYQIADIGDYLKVFACSAVISQPIMSLVMDVEQPVHTQDVFGVFFII